MARPGAFTPTFRTLFLLLAGLAWQAAVGQDVVGCGGFVRTNKNIDVTRIQMTLFSKKSGNLRYSSAVPCRLRPPMGIAQFFS
jgi:hypothetical protein